MFSLVMKAQRMPRARRSASVSGTPGRACLPLATQPSTSKMKPAMSLGCAIVSHLVDIRLTIRQCGRHGLIPVALRLGVAARRSGREELIPAWLDALLHFLVHFDWDRLLFPLVGD